MKVKQTVLISKELQAEIKDIMRRARQDSIRYEPNEGVDAYYDGMRDLKFTEESARMLLGYAQNTEYVEGSSTRTGKRISAQIKPGWLPVYR
jgi:hypothetical protein